MWLRIRCPDTLPSPLSDLRPLRIYWTLARGAQHYDAPVAVYEPRLVSVAVFAENVDAALTDASIATRTISCIVDFISSAVPRRVWCVPRRLGAGRQVGDGKGNGETKTKKNFKKYFFKIFLKWEAVSTSNHFQNHFQVTSAAVTRRGDKSRLLIGARGK